jgi:hypothetical protein
MKLDVKGVWYLLGSRFKRWTSRKGRVGFGVSDSAYLHLS